MAIKTLLPLLCLCLLALSAYAHPPFQAVSKFDASELSDVKWYELFFASSFTSELVACPREVYTPIGNGKIVFQYGQYYPGLYGDFQSLLFTMKQQGNTGKFKIIDDQDSNQYYYVLDYDCDYNWIVFAVASADPSADVIVAISKSPKDLVALQRVVEIAGQYGLDSHNLELQSTKCPYNKIFYKLKSLRKSL